jgi:hypothetical protein
LFELFAPLPLFILASRAPRHPAPDRARRFAPLAILRCLPRRVRMRTPARLTAATILPVAVATGLFTILCVLLALWSSPRRVGDGVEYWAMAEQMRRGLAPAASRGELSRLERDARAIGRGFDQSPVRFPQLVGADGRQDFPHFWLYPLLNVPALALVTAVGLHPNWAFTLTNVLLLALAFAIVARTASIAWAALILAGPLIWWIDKAHGDVFTVALLAVACAAWQRTPTRTVVLVAIAAAQNPALMPVWALVSAFALWSAIDAVRGADARADARPASRLAPVVVAIGIGAAIVAVPLAYYWSRLGVWSPLIGYTHPAWPSLRAVVSLLVDPNVGLVFNAPFVAAAGIWTIATHGLRAIRDGGDREARRGAADARGGHPAPAPRRPGASLSAALSAARSWRGWMLAAGACVLLLAAYAQSINLNHGATPGLNRWTLWLTPWLLLLGDGRRREPIQTHGVHIDARTDARRADQPRRAGRGRGADAGPNSHDARVPDAHVHGPHGRDRDARNGAARTGARVLAGLAVVNVMWAVWFFRPSQPEVYRYPTQVAAWLWTHAPRWYEPAPEIFAERVSHREPPLLPVAWPGCTKVLIVDGRWPASCPPTAPAPASCLGADRLCYATPLAPVTPSSSPASGETPSPALPTMFTPLGPAPFPWIPAPGARAPDASSPAPSR